MMLTNVEDDLEIQINPNKIRFSPDIVVSSYKQVLKNIFDNDEIYNIISNYSIILKHKDFIKNINVNNKFLLKCKKNNNGSGSFESFINTNGGVFKDVIIYNYNTIGGCKYRTVMSGCQFHKIKLSDFDSHRSVSTQNFQGVAASEGGSRSLRSVSQNFQQMNVSKNNDLHLISCQNYYKYRIINVVKSSILGVRDGNEINNARFIIRSESNLNDGESRESKINALRIMNGMSIIRKIGYEIVIGNWRFFYYVKIRSMNTNIERFEYLRKIIEYKFNNKVDKIEIEYLGSNAEEFICDLFKIISEL
jgi:hypothetical protein